MQRLAIVLILALGMPAIIFDRQPEAQAKARANNQADAQARAALILKQARAAIGDESKLKALQSLSATGNMRVTFNENQIESEIEVELLMPDKIKRTINSQRGTNISALDGDQLWNDFIPAMGTAGGPGGGFPGGGRRGGDGTSPMATYFRQQQRRELLQIMLGWLLVPPSSAQMQFSYIGEAPGPNGKVDVLDGKTPDGITTRLYIDQQTHRLAGLSYKAKQFRRLFGGPGGPGGGRRRTADDGERQRPQISDEEREKRREQRAREMLENFEKAPEADYRWAFDDYKGVGGLNLPHRLTKIEDGTPNEEWEIARFKINPKLSADRFVKKEREKAPERPQ